MEDKDYEELQKKVIRLEKENEILKENMEELEELREDNFNSNLIIDFIDMNYKELNSQTDNDLLTPKEKLNNIELAQDFLQGALSAYKETKLPIDDDFIRGLESMVNEIIKLSINLYKDIPEEIAQISLTKD